MVATLDAPYHVRQRWQQPSQEPSVRTIADPQPHNDRPSPFPPCSFHKVFILADNQSLMPLGILPNRGVLRVPHPQILDMFSLVSLRCQRSCKARGQLSINQEADDHCAISSHS